MSKSRKVLCALLAVMMVFSVFSISAFAANELWEAEDATWTQEWSLGNPTPTNVANQYTVDIILSTNYNVGPVSFKLTGVTSIDAVAVGAGYYSGAQTDKVNTGANLGLVFMFPLTPTGTTVGAKSCDSAVIATVTYTTSAANGAVTIANDPKNADNPNGTLVATRCTAGTVDDSQFVAGQKVTVNNPGGEVELQVKAGSSVIINSTYTLGGQYDGVVYGFSEISGAGNQMANTSYITNNLKASDGSALDITPSKGTRYGSGSVISVGGKKYAVIVFGDANGDGRINTQDVGTTNKYYKGTETPTALLQLASQTKVTTVVNQLKLINTQDLGEVNKHYKGIADVNQVGMAEALTSKVVDAYL